MGVLHISRSCFRCFINLPVNPCCCSLFAFEKLTSQIINLYYWLSSFHVNSHYTGSILNNAHIVVFILVAADSSMV